MEGYEGMIDTPTRRCYSKPGLTGKVDFTGYSGNRPEGGRRTDDVICLPMLLSLVQFPTSWFASESEFRRVQDAYCILRQVPRWSHSKDVDDTSAQMLQVAGRLHQFDVSTLRIAWKIRLLDETFPYDEVRAKFMERSASNWNPTAFAFLRVLFEVSLHPGEPDIAGQITGASDLDSWPVVLKAGQLYVEADFRWYLHGFSVYQPLREFDLLVKNGRRRLAGDSSYSIADGAPHKGKLHDYPVELTELELSNRVIELLEASYGRPLASDTIRSLRSYGEDVLHDALGLWIIGNQFQKKDKRTTEQQRSKFASEVRERLLSKPVARG